jgi:hypothetical protein
MQEVAVPDLVLVENVAGKKIHDSLQWPSGDQESDDRAWSSTDMAATGGKHARSDLRRASEDRISRSITASCMMRIQQHPATGPVSTGPVSDHHFDGDADPLRRCRRLSSFRGNSSYREAVVRGRSGICRPSGPGLRALRSVPAMRSLGPARTRPFDGSARECLSRTARRSDVSSSPRTRLVGSLNLSGRSDPTRGLPFVVSLLDTMRTLSRSASEVRAWAIAQHRLTATITPSPR